MAITQKFRDVKITWRQPQKVVYKNNNFYNFVNKRHYEFDDISVEEQTNSTAKQVLKN